MELNNKVIIVTGAGSGIGKALVERFAQESPMVIIGADIANTETILDVTDGEAVKALVDQTVENYGRVDLYCSNAGIATGAGIEATDDQWSKIWEVNVMGTVHAARALLPGVEKTGLGYLLVTASAAGLLTNLGDAPYTATKHAAVGLAEWLSITHGDAGLRVSCLCPQGVRTPMVTSGLDSGHMAAAVVDQMGLIEPADCAEAVVAGLADERFLILPHPEVAEYQKAKTANIDRWLGGMRKLQRHLTS